MINAAAEYGPVIIALNSDAWLTRKKGRPFMIWSERAEILRALLNVEDVYPVDDGDGTVCEAIRRYRPAEFGNGGDRTDQNTPELALCRELEIEPVFWLGGGKVQSSSDLIRASLA